MAPSCVVVGQLASLWGVWWVVCIWGLLFGFSLSVPSLASVFAMSFPVMPECARTLWRWIVCSVQCICFIIYLIKSLSGWWCCDVGC
jgi:hypothetical protein